MNPDHLNPRLTHVPEIAGQIPTNGQSSDALFRRRLQKVQAFEERAFENSDPLAANLELVCSNLMRMDAQFAQESQQLLSELSSAADRINCLYSLAEPTYKNAKALHFLLEFLQRHQKAAQNSTDLATISSRTINDREPGNGANQRPGVTVRRKAK